MLGEQASLLDLFSTSQTKHDLYERQSKRLREAKTQICSYNSPFFAYQIKLAHYGVTQGCCNHWDCPRCGAMRAKEEYGRMVEGVGILSSQYPLYMLTVTCRGSNETTETAEKNYGRRTNVFLTAFRARVKRAGGEWCYVSVTERQKRGHPHSHFITTASPGDIVEGYVLKRISKGKEAGKWKSIPALRSEWLQNAVIRAELGEQYDISLIRSWEGASRYCAKYLFKASMFEANYPKGWKRIRYSNNFPKLPEIKSDAFPLIDFHDWHLLGRRAAFVTVSDKNVLGYVQRSLSHSDTIVQLK
jgi:hypothetical protein